jgi:hypothetical protein
MTTHAGGPPRTAAGAAVFHLVVLDGDNRADTVLAQPDVVAG